MSDMRDATGLRGSFKTYAEVQYEYEPATGTVWGWMNQRGNPCFILSLLKDLRSFGGDLTANSGHVVRGLHAQCALLRGRLQGAEGL